MSRAIRVLHLGSPASLYGAERWILSLVKYLEPIRIESLIGVINDANYRKIPLCIEAARLGYGICEIQAPGRFNVSAIAKLRSYIKSNQIDILHTHYFKPDIIGLFATIGTQCKIISTPHGFTNNPSLALRAYEGLSKCLFPFFDAVVPLSKGVMEGLVKIPGLARKMLLIDNGVDIAGVESQVDVASEISELKRHGKYVLGYIGRLTPGKGLTVLLESIAKYSDEDWHVALIGEGEQEQELRLLVEQLDIVGRVDFFGFRPDRLAFLKGFDVFVLPSRSEGIPRCLMEAMAAGIPIIASNIDGCRNLVNDGSTGLLFDVDNPQMLAEQVRKLRKSPDLSNMLSVNARAFLEERYSAARMAKEYELLYARMVETAK